MAVEMDIGQRTGLFGFEEREKESLQIVQVTIFSKRSTSEITDTAKQ